MPVERPMPALTCPEPATLLAYDNGDLPPAVLESIAQHLERCADCLRALQSLERQPDALVAGLRRCAVPAPPPAEDERRIIALIEGLADPYATVAPPARPTDPDESGAAHERIGPYELLEPLGAGGMGSVYKARHVHLGKIVALKQLPPDRVPTAAMRTRFLQEMQAIGRLEHPHIVQAFDAAVAEVPYLAMEYVAGTDLARLVHARGPLPVADACELVRQAALGLQHAHEHGLVHRDIKPSNLMLTTKDVVKVLDLGLARLQADEPAAESLTAAGVMMGTPDYMAPEQLLDAHAVDIRADIYSLGCTLYHLLTGRPPFAEHADLASKRKAHLREPLPSIRSRRPEVPLALAAVLDRMTAKEPADRHATPAEVAAALQPFTAGSSLAPLVEPAPAPPAAPETIRPLPTTLPATLNRPPRRPWMQGLIAAAALLGVVLGGVALWRTLEPRWGPLRVTEFTLLHYRPRGDDTDLLSTVGGPGDEPARPGDLVRVEVLFSKPAYCYLIAFNPDGQDQLCYPYRDRADRPPEPLTELRYPLGTKYFPLTDGAGLQAFVVLASERPLPAYAAWRRQAAPLKWQKADGSGVWHWQGDQVAPWGGRRRATETERPAPTAFLDLCSFLKERAGTEVKEAITFPVKAK